MTQHATETELLHKIKQLEKTARQLEPDIAQRQRLLDHVIAYAEEYLEAIPDRIADPSPSALENALRQEQRTEISRAIGRLSRNQAQAVLMRVVQDEPYSSIAQALGCSEATARTHVARARTRLAELLSHLAPQPTQEAIR